MDSKTLAGAFDYIRQQRIPIHSLLIVRNGHVVLDAYFWPFQERQLHDVASVTKSVASSLVGIASGKHNTTRVRMDGSDTVRAEDMIPTAGFAAPAAQRRPMYPPGG